MAADKTVKRIQRIGETVAVAFIALVPLAASAQVANFVFTSEPQTIEIGTASDQLSVQAQDSSGTSTNVPSTTCLSLTTTSAQGQFSSSASSWNPVVVLTMNKNTSNKNFYYKDTLAGTQTLTVRATLRPESVTSSCASWPIEQWNIQWTATQNVSIGSQNSNSSVSTTTTTTTAATAPASASAPTSSYVAPPEPQIFADAGNNRTVIVAADTEFIGRAYNRKKETVSGRIRFMWNFGDGSTAEGPSVLHHFDYPGRYVVVLNIAENLDAASDKIIVTAEPAKLSFTALSDGSIAIGNNAGRDLDLSGWIIRSFGRTFIVPKDSIVLAGESLRIGDKTLGFRSSPDTELDYPNGALALKAGIAVVDPNPPTLNTSPVAVTSSHVPSTSAPVSSVSAGTETDTSGDVSLPEIADVAEESSSTSSQVASVSGAVSGSASTYIWWLGAIGLAVAGGGAVIAARRAGKREWEIVEEREE